MPEYIEREAAMDIFGDVPMWDGYYEPYPFEVHCAIVGVVKLIKEELRKVPAADVSPVRHGRWERTADGAALCTACKRKMNPSQYGYAFCSLCGAKMDGGRDQ